MILPHSESTEEEDEDERDAVDLAEDMEDQGTGDVDDDPAVFAGLVELSHLSKRHPVTLMSKLRPGVV